MSTLIVILYVALVVVCLLLILLVLMQRPKQEGLGAAFGAGITDQVWGNQTTDVLQKGTVRLGVALFVLSLTLCMVKASEAKKDVADIDTSAKPVVSTPTPAESTSAPVVVPAPAPITVPAGEPVAVPAIPAVVPAATVEPVAPAPAPAVAVPAAEPAPAEVKPAAPAKKNK